MENPFTKITIENRRVSKPFVFSVLFHIAFIIGAYCLSELASSKKPFARVATFSLVALRAPDDVSTTVHSAVSRSSAPAPVAVQEPQTAHTVDSRDLNPTPSSQKSTDTAVAAVQQFGAGAGSGSVQNGGGGGSFTGQGALRVGSATMLDNTDFEPIYQPALGYPLIAKKAQIEGYVDAELTISEAGLVEDFGIVSVIGHPSFAAETARILPTYRFPPPRIGGKRVKIKYLYRVRFQLQ